MGFKEDADFARFVAMGAVGAAAAADVLRDRYGHEPVEFERYAMANKVWQSKVKRLRLPDLLCARCGLRVEARAKSKLGIVLSHSDASGRKWDDGGMRNSDLFAFMRVDSLPGTFPPTVAEPMWFSTAALRASAHHARRSSPKAASEGSEVTMTWPCWVPSSGGTFERVDHDGRIVWRDDAGKRKLYWHWRQWAGKRHLYLRPGDTFEPAAHIVASIVSPPASLACPGPKWDVTAALSGDDAVERLAAVRSMSATEAIRQPAPLIRVALNESEDWRVALEARVALARVDPGRWVPLVAAAANVDAERERAMEAVLALTEVDTAEALDALCDIAAQDGMHEDVRAAAAWGIGQGAAARPERLLPLVLDDEPLVALHAASAVDAVTDEMSAELLAWLGSGDEHKAAAAANVLARSRRIDVLLDAYERGDPTRKWAVYALGSTEASIVRARAQERLTPELRGLLEPMWLRELDWLQTDDDPLAALDLQKVRFDPLRPRLDDIKGAGPAASQEHAT
ncbi:MAG: HEAT repeat domain-containing protein [Acidimicrobiaceae bacterium]|nr:HEAT repeat domain-containing protein [Acidimicrobiaceae bacterium]